MKSVNIYSVGSCDATTREGMAKVLLEFSGEKRHLYTKLQDTTSNRCIIAGLIKAVETLKEPHAVKLVTSTKIGTEKAKKGKGANVELVNRLISLLQEKKCTFEFEVWEGRALELQNKTRTGR